MGGIVQGIVQAAGFGVLDTASVAIIADEDGQNMQLLAGGMTPNAAYTSSEVVNLCQTRSSMVS